ncbi:MAG: hypothetical protein J5659_03645 [Clostridia bacterium]|nr:hypothetical protein [Clostridia bacterium]
MSKKTNDYNDNFIMDIDFSYEDKGDLLAGKNKEVLSAFGDNISLKTGDNRTVSDQNDNKALSPLASLKAKVKVNTNADDDINSSYTEISHKKNESDSQTSKNEADKKSEEKDISLLEKLKRYTIDEKGHDVTKDEAPLYKLESVAEIIKSDSNSLINQLSEKYNVTIDTLGKPEKDDFLLEGIDENNDAPDKTEEIKENPKENEQSPSPTPTFKRLANESKQRFEKSIFDEIFPNETEKSKESDSIPDISDIDNSHMVEKGDTDYGELSDTATIRFTPIKDEKGNTGRINISSSTRIIDINQELTGANEAEQQSNDTVFETSDFDLFTPKGEITDMLSAKAFARNLYIKRRNNFLSMLICVLCAFVTSLFLTPFLSDKVISSTKSVVILCSTLLFISIAANIKMFIDLFNLFKHSASHDCLVALCAIFSIPLCIIAMVNGENIYHLILLSSLIILIRSIIKFLQTSATLLNVNAIKNKREKFAVSFIKDSSTALAMAKNAIDGDVLIAAPKKAEFIGDYLKFSLYKKKFSGKIPIVFITTLVLSVIGAAMGYFYYKSAFAAIYAAYAATVMAAMPAVMFVDALPLFSASRKLSKKGGMIAGTFGADSIELANAAVIETSDIFPSGSIKLKNFRVLSENDVDKTIVNAAALTEAIGSPLAPIFNKIAGTNTSYKKPDSDTIKYEEKLGISGWVDNELLFIGNRTLMEAHGIEVPSIEVDKKILRNGYFPVYVGTESKANALIVIQYEVRSDIQKLLRQISRLGVTLLIRNCDPNVSEEMICDYFGLYDDSVKVMTNVGVHMYEGATAKTSFVSAPASFSGSKLALLQIMNCASRIRISNNILSVFYVLASILGIWYFAFTSFAQSAGMLSGLSILIFELLATVFSLLAFLFRKP